MFKKVVVGVSGGIDSAVAALLLKSKGFDVTGVFMKNWDIVNEVGICQAEEDFEDAKWVCNRLQIPIIEVNFVKDYWNNVFSNLIENYELGRTPNPDIQCNKNIKFYKFFDYARQNLGADAIATGHYAVNSFGSYLENFDKNKDAALLKSRDRLKDQTFFLSQIPQVSLRRTMFPLGEFLKSDVKRIAKEANLERVLNKKESMGICFIGKRQFKNFIAEYIKNKTGDFIDIETGRCIGKHDGIHLWTVGQCCRIGGMPASYFVYRKDINKNIIFVVPGKRHPALFTDLCIVSKISWIRKEPDPLICGYTFDCDFKFQHSDPLTRCTIFKIGQDKMMLRIHKPLRAVTSGQFAVFYSEDECLGSAEITSPGPCCYFLNKEVPDIMDKSKELKMVFNR